MEGYTDCIIAHQYGFANTVAVLGTALGEGHIKILKRFADRIILVLDGDEAGQKRANEVLELFVAQQVDLRIVTLPQEKDPCDFLLKHGAEAFGEVMEKHAVDALEHAFQTATRGVDLDRDVHGATRALDRLIEIVAKAPRHRDDTTRESRLREEKILQRLAARFRIDEARIRGQVTELRRKQGQGGPRTFQQADDMEAAGEEQAPIDAWERELMEILIQHPGRMPRVQEAIGPEQIVSSICRRIYRTCCQLTDAGVLPAFDRLMLEFDDAETKNLLVELDEQGRAKGSRISDPGALLEALIAGYQKREEQRHRPAQNVALREGQMDEDQQLELLQRIVQQERARQGISNPTDG
jgi:DNA primase